MAGPNIYRERDTVFDFSKVASDPARLRMIAAIDVLYRTASPGNGLWVLISGIRSRSGRSIQFFDDELTALKGTRSPRVRANAGGFSLWTSDSRFSGWSDQDIDVKDRTEERVCIFPSKFGHDDAWKIAATWHELTHIFAPLNHGWWDITTNQYTNPQSQQNQAWIAQITAEKICAPATDIDPATETPESIQWGTGWVCNCGTVHEVVEAG